MLTPNSGKCSTLRLYTYTCLRLYLIPANAPNHGIPMPIILNNGIPMAIKLNNGIPMPIIPLLFLVFDKASVAVRQSTPD